MQRQSLGSPGLKQHLNGGGLMEALPIVNGGSFTAAEAEDEIKEEKAVRPSPPPSRTIHLIPILTVLCFLILYLTSHEPSPFDLPGTRGIERIVHPKAGSVSGLVSAAIRSKRGLMEIRSRKLGGSPFGV